MLSSTTGRHSGGRIVLRLPDMAGCFKAGMNKRAGCPVRDILKLQFGPICNSFVICLVLLLKILSFLLFPPVMVSGTGTQNCKDDQEEESVGFFFLVIFLDKM